MTKVVFHTYESSKYDGTNTYAKLVDILEDDVSNPNHPLWNVVNRGEAGDINKHDHEVWLYTDNPSVYGFPPQTVTVFGEELTYDDFQTGEYVGDSEKQIFVLELTA